MGLNCSHDAFDGAYSAFNRLRQFVCYTLGIISGEYCSFPPHYAYTSASEADKQHYSPLYEGQFRKIPELDPDKFYVPELLDKRRPGLWEFLSHSDCDGEISPEMCLRVAEDLEWLLPTVKGMHDLIETGHIARNGGYAKVIETFAQGCRRAASNNEPLLFR